MSQIHWAKQISADFNTKADWVGGAVPAASDDAILDASGTLAYTVTASTDQTVSSIQTASTATLAVLGVLFDATGGTGSGVSAGLLAVGGGATLELGGTLDNTGIVSLDDHAALSVAAGGVRLTGAGMVELDGATIAGATSAATLTNAGEAIEGGGQLGGGSLTLVNQAAGVIASEGALALAIDTGANTVVNAGLIVAEGPGGVTIAGPVDNQGELAVNGGPLTVTGDVTGAGDLVVVNGVLKFEGASDQAVVFTDGSVGTLELAHSVSYPALVRSISGFSTSGATALVLDDVNFVQDLTTATYSTGGLLTVTDGPNAAYFSLIGNYGGLTFATVAAGANGVGVRIVVALPVHWAAPVSGAFTAAADWRGDVAPGPTDEAIVDASGSYTVTASSSQTVADIQTAPTATLSITGGVFDAPGGTGQGFNAGSIAVAAGATLAVGARFDNAHLVTLADGATLMVGGAPFFLTGLGMVLLGETTGSRITAAAGNSTMVNQSVIEGGGQIGGGGLRLENQGVIASEGPAPLVIDTGANTIFNGFNYPGTIVAEGSGGVTISSPIDNEGELAVNGGPMTIVGALTGGGVSVVVNGVLKFEGAANQEVVFTDGSVGTLELTHSLSDQGLIAGLSTTGTDALDLDDISFATGRTTAAYVGGSASGRLTVTDLYNTVSVSLYGDYTDSSFILGSDGHGGTRIVAMGPISWAAQVSGAFANGADWSGGIAPGAADGASLGAPGSKAYTVTSTTSETVSSIQIASTATLSVTGGVFDSVNGATNAGVISEANGASIELGDFSFNTITNAGLILAAGAGGVTIDSGVVNSGRLAVNGGSMTVTGAVTGAGYGEVVSGTLDFAGAFNENVVFTSGSTGTLELGDSLGYTQGSIQGLSTTGANALDLGDITFTSGVTTATFNGSSTSGVLTVTDGSHTARINLVGDYLGSTFTTSLGAGGVGTRIVDPPASPSPASLPLVPAPHAFIAAMAALAPQAGGQVQPTSHLDQGHASMIAMPKFTQAA